VLRAPKADAEKRSLKRQVKQLEAKVQARREVRALEKKLAALEVEHDLLKKAIRFNIENASIPAWAIIPRSSSNAWHMPSKVSPKSMCRSRWCCSGGPSRSPHQRCTSTRFSSSRLFTFA